MDASTAIYRTLKVVDHFNAANDERSDSGFTKLLKLGWDTIELLVLAGAEPLNYGAFSTTFRAGDMVYAVVFDEMDGSKQLLTNLAEIAPNPHLPQIEWIHVGREGESVYRMPYYRVYDDEEMTDTQKTLANLVMHAGNGSTKTHIPHSKKLPDTLRQALEIIRQNLPDGSGFDLHYANIGWDNDTLILLDPIVI